MIRNTLTALALVAFAALYVLHHACELRCAGAWPQYDLWRGECLCLESPGVAAGSGPR